jgi:phytanoyl-CoA hydroxylase
MVATEHIEQFRREGYVIARGLFSKQEADFYIDHYMRLREASSYPGDFSGVDPTSNDPLKRYPRMIHMHRWDEVSLKWLIDPRLNEWLTALLGTEPYAAQTMLYFKPPGARGQALHQDNFYLRVQPGTCMAAWMALDPCDEENGCLMVVPGTHNLPILCTIPADTTESFTNIAVPVPKDLPIVPAVMEPGDVLFFNGSLVHGSYPNRSANRFRRALIGHYATGDAQKIAQFYQPLLRMDGTEVTIEVSEGGGPCGVWVERDGRPVVEMVEPQQKRPVPDHE